MDGKEDREIDTLIEKDRYMQIEIDVQIEIERYNERKTDEKKDIKIIEGNKERRMK